MSISEIKMFVNSNTSEPLNFCQYINDISMFGSDSYVLAEQNIVQKFTKEEFYNVWTFKNT